MELPAPTAWSTTIRHRRGKDGKRKRSRKRKRKRRRKKSEGGRRVSFHQDLKGFEFQDRTWEFSDVIRQPNVEAHQRGRLLGMQSAPMGLEKRDSCVGCGRWRAGIVVDSLRTTLENATRHANQPSGRLTQCCVEIEALSRATTEISLCQSNILVKY